MCRVKNGGHIKSAYIQMTRSNVCVRLVNDLHEPYQALSSASMGNRTVTLTLLESIAKVPDRQVTKTGKINRLFSDFFFLSSFFSPP